MRHIAKEPEPTAFSHWKAQTNEDWQPSWDILQNPEKRAVKQALLVEQGYLCAYCCQSVEDATSHIDHVVPGRRPEDPHALDYGNMIVSGPGEPEEGADYPQDASRPPELIHCGHAKGEWYDPALFVDPRDPACEHAFTFTATGRIRVADAAPTSEAARETIDHLNLDCAPLRRQRAAAIAVELDRLATLLEVQGTLSRADITARIDRLRKRNDDGRFAPFAPAILDILGQRAATLP